MAKNTIKQLAYSINTEQKLDYSTYRLSRGFIFKRAGSPVPVIPQFKGIQIVTQNFTPTAANPSNSVQTALSSFSTPTTTAINGWTLLKTRPSLGG